MKDARRILAFLVRRQSSGGFEFEDVVQDALLRSLGFDPGRGRWGPWIWFHVAHALADAKKSTSRSRLMVWHASEPPLPVDVLLVKEKVAAVMARISSQSFALVLTREWASKKRTHSMPLQKEIARSLGVSPSQVSRRARQAFDAIRENARYA